MNQNTINKLSTVHSPFHDVYKNLATEECLIDSCGEDELILMLWQNDSCIVIGKNQDIWSECEPDSFPVARRKSGGGAVFHDLGNLNYSIITSKENFDRTRCLEIICAALRRFNLNVSPSGKNDIILNFAEDSAKISGTAVYEKGSNKVFHGTFLIDVNIDNMEKALTPSQEKLNRHGVESVRARVINLQKIKLEITVEALASTIQSEFESNFANVNEITNLSCFKNLDELTNFYASDSWIFHAIN